MADTDPVDPFGATVTGVTALLPQATFPDQLSAGQKGVTKSMIRGYVEDVTGMVQARLAGWARLNQAHRTIVVAAGRDIVHNGAGSYTQAARFPELADKADDTYAEVLWKRYTQALDELAAQVEEWLRDPTAVDDPAGAGLGAAWCFPAPRFTEQTGF